MCLQDNLSNSLNNKHTEVRIIVALSSYPKEHMVFNFDEIS